MFIINGNLDHTPTEFLIKNIRDQSSKEPITLQESQKIWIIEQV